MVGYPHSFGRPLLVCHLSLADGKTARFAKRIVPLISGRVLAQVSPRFGYDQKAIEDHCRAYKKAFNAEGVSECVI
jgi:hypothetical protein